MYTKSRGERPSFGDIYEAPCFFDIYLRSASEALTFVDLGAKGHRFNPSRGNRARQPGKDFALAFATPEVAEELGEGEGSDAQVLAFGNQRRAILLSDDCETESVIRRGGRLLFATLSAWPENEEEQKNLIDGDTAWRRFGLPPNADIAFEGAVVDLARCAMVWHEDLEKATALFGLDDGETTALKANWCAYASRHGPLVAADGAYKLAEMSYINGDPERWEKNRWELQEELPSNHQDAVVRITNALTLAWNIEGDHFDVISDAHEQRESAKAHVDTTIERLVSLRDATDAAIDAVRKL